GPRGRVRVGFWVARGIRAAGLVAALALIRRVDLPARSDDEPATPAATCAFVPNRAATAALSASLLRGRARRPSGGRGGRGAPPPAPPPPRTPDLAAAGVHARLLEQGERVRGDPALDD